MTFEHGQQSRLWQLLCTSALCWLCSGKGEELPGNCRSQNSGKPPAVGSCGHWTWEKREKQSTIVKQTVKKRFFFFPCRVHCLLKARSKTNKKQAGQVSAMHLLDYIFCLFCLQKTLVTISSSLADHDIFARFSWPLGSHLISHCKAHVDYQAASFTVQNGKFWPPTPDSLLSL